MNKLISGALEININSAILSEGEKGIFLDLLKTNNKFLGKDWKLLYRKSTDGRYKDEEFVKQRYILKKHILFIVESDNGNVFGGYSSVGWIEFDAHISRMKHMNYPDDMAYIFGIRSSKTFDPMISNVNTASYHAEGAIRNGYHYFGMGIAYVIIISPKTEVVKTARHASSYLPLPTDYHLLGGVAEAKVRNLEIFQIQE